MKQVDPTTIGLVGCGNISDTYLKISKKFPNIEIIACSDIVIDRAKEKARKYEVPKVYTINDMLKDPEIEIVLNLTPPKAHEEIALHALEAGKSVYNEKPLATNKSEGRKILQVAKERGLRVGCAPDTFLGGGIQTCRKLIDDGHIGEPVAFAAFVLSHGHERWHPDPEFFYGIGGGPMFDMGPYYLTALITLIGPVRQVSGMAKTTFSKRTITSQPKYGLKIKVEVPTHISSLVRFANGVAGTLVTSYDVWGAKVPSIEIYGTKGSLSVPDPNGFGGPVKILHEGSREWNELALTHGFVEQNRSIGIAEMAKAMKLDRIHRANGELAYHVLDVMESIINSERLNRHVEIQSTCKRPRPLPPNLDGILD